MLAPRLRRNLALALAAAVLGACAPFRTPPREFSWEPQSQLGWPVRGVIASTFGDSSRPGHQGVDLRSRPGEAIVAATGGEVSFVGEVPGYGRVVVLSHESSLTTVYAHVGEASVAAGTRVDRGDPIGRVGPEGMLHYEIRQAKQPVDPMSFYALAPKPILGGASEARAPDEPGSAVPVGAERSREAAREEAERARRAAPTATVRAGGVVSPTPTPTPPAPPRREPTATAEPTATPTRVPAVRIVPTATPTAPPARTRRPTATATAKPGRRAAAGRLGDETPPLAATPAGRAEPRAAHAGAAAEPGVGAGTTAALVLTNVLYVPVKLLYSGIGGLTAGVAWVLSAGDRDVAGQIWERTTGGDYMVRAEHFRDARLRFGGDPAPLEPEPPASGARPEPAALEDVPRGAEADAEEPTPRASAPRATPTPRPGLREAAPKKPAVRKAPAKKRQKPRPSRKSRATSSATRPSPSTR